MNQSKPLLLILILAALAMVTRSQMTQRAAADSGSSSEGITKPQSVSFIGSNAVATAFSKGMPLVENSQFKIHASRRDAPGMAEIHVRDTDIIYVLEGSATFITGGTATETNTIAPNEIRGTGIQGGESRRISKGDVIVVPNGLPHWFQQVDGPLVYYVVKITSK
jgi:glc operon protein GlcG